MKTDKQKLIDLQDEFLTYFNPNAEYGTGYLDCLYEVCEKLGIPAKRLYDYVQIGG